MQARDGARRNHQDMVRADRVAVMGLGHRHGGPARQDRRQHAGAVRPEVKDDDESQPAIGRHFFKEAAKCLYPAGRSTDTDNGNGHFVHCNGRCDSPHTGPGIQKPPPARAIWSITE